MPRFRQFPGLPTGTWLRFDWMPKPAEVSRSILDVENYLADLTPPLLLARRFIIGDVKLRFEKQIDPQGRPWKKWAENYKGQAKDNVGILRRPGQALYEAVTSDAAYPIRGNALFIEQDAIYTDYGMAHETGLTTASGRTSELPKRSFLGPSDRTQEAIATQFGRWFQGSVAIYTRRGVPFAQPRDIRSKRFTGAPIPLL